MSYLIEAAINLVLLAAGAFAYANWVAWQAERQERQWAKRHRRPYQYGGPSLHSIDPPDLDCSDLVDWVAGEERDQ